MKLYEVVVQTTFLVKANSERESICEGERLKTELFGHLDNVRKVKVVSGRESRQTNYLENCDGVEQLKFNF